MKIDCSWVEALFGRPPALLLTGLLCVVLSTNLFALEKKKKESDAVKQDTVQSVAKPATTKSPGVRGGVSSSKPDGSPKVFNDFIDANRNGVDDRLEQGLKPEQKKAPIRPPIEVKKVVPPKVPTEKTPSEKTTKKNK